MKNIFFKLLVIQFVIFFVTGCKKDLKTPQWDSDIILPIAKTSLNLSKIKIDSSGNVLLQSDPDGQVRLVFENSLFSVDFDSLFRIPDTSITEAFAPFFNINLNPGQQIWAGEVDNKYDLNSIELRTLEFRSGFLRLDISNTLTEKIIIDFNFKKSLLNGQVFNKQIEVPAGSISNPTVVHKDYDMTGLITDLTGDNGTNFNKMLIAYTITLDPSGNSTTATLGDKVSLTSAFDNLIPAYGKGYFGQILEQDTLNEKISAMDKILSGEINLQQVQMELTLTNKLGVSLQTTLWGLESHNSKTNTSVALNHSIVGNSINIDRATESGNPLNPVNYKTLSYHINSSNSNIHEFMENLPDSISLAIDMALNPNGNESYGNDFVYYENGVDIGLNLNIPLSLSLDQLVIIDTLAFSLDSNDSYNQINSGYLNIFANNTFPLDLNFDLVVTDSNFTIIDTLTSTSNTIKSAVLGQNGITTAVESKIQIPLSKEKINSLYAGELILLKARLSTYDAPQIVNIYNSYYCDLQIVADFNYRIK